MSAWLVSKKHIDIIITAALFANRGNTFRWYFEGKWRELRLDNADEIGQMLINQNAEANPISHFNLQGPQRAVDQYKLRKIGQHWDGKEWVWIWLVRGRQVRRHLQKNFTMGGHHYVYPQIPENEIWIDDHNYDERAPTIVHECDERIDMKFKKHSYHHGHNKANRTQRDFEIKNDDILREGYSPRRVPILIRGASR